MDFKVPAQTARFEQEIKKSRFIAFASSAPTVSAAQEFIDQIKNKFSDARHVCWAFVVGQPGNTSQVGFSDAGEPNGTAGMPMLNVLQHGEIGDIVVVVVRYFGGIKLGTGGLARAYSGSVSSVIKLIPTKLKIVTIPVSFYVDFSLEDQVRRCLRTAGIGDLHIQYDQQLKIECEFPQDRFYDLENSLSDLSRGQIKINKNQ